MSSGEEVLFEVVGEIAVITLNRPAQRNAVSRALSRQLRESLMHLEGDAALRVGVLTGAGDRAFCAGLDLKEAAGSALGVPARDFLPMIGDSLRMSKPVIAAVNGVAYAGGWALAQMCDLCVAADHARFAITEARFGRGMPWAVPLLRMLPQRVVLELLLTGREMTAQRAFDLGFVNEVAPARELMQVALALAKEIASNAPLTVRAARMMVRQSADMGLTDGLNAAYELFDPVYLSDDAQEGPRAFAERRKPNWRAR